MPTEDATGTSSATRSCPESRRAFPGAVDAFSAFAPGALVASQASLPISGLTAESARAWLRAGVSDRRIEEILRQAHAAAGANPVVRLPDGDTVRRYGDRLYRVSSLALRDMRESENQSHRGGARPCDCRTAPLVGGAGQWACAVEWG